MMSFGKAVPTDIGMIILYLANAVYSFWGQMYLFLGDKGGGKSHHLIIFNVNKRNKTKKKYFSVCEMKNLTSYLLTERHFLA